jgi:hypothetical protein
MRFWGSGAPEQFLVSLDGVLQVEFLRIQGEVPRLMHLRFDGHCFRSQRVVVPTNKQRVIVLFVAEAGQ